jgi:hypothetical protein
MREIALGVVEGPGIEDGAGFGLVFGDDVEGAGGGALSGIDVGNEVVG